MTGAAVEERKKGTVMLLSGQMDKALVAFMIVTGFAAMGVEMKVWFTLWGANCLKKRRGLFVRSPRYDLVKESKYRKPETDFLLQSLVETLNRGGAGYLPLSQLNLMGLGPRVFNLILRRKHMATLEELILAAHEQGVPFALCQICVDALGLSVDDLIIPDVPVKGVTAYMKDAMGAHFNIII
jgi:peroxiredoxin family protein